MRAECVFIEDIAPGMSASHSKTVTETDIVLFGAVSGDTNPVHFDEEHAKGTMFRGRIAHGLLSASFLSTVLGTKLPGSGTVFMGLNVRFKAPVRIGDTVTATCTVREIVAEKRRVILDCVCKVKDTVVIDGEALVMAPSRAAA